DAVRGWSGLGYGDEFAEDDRRLLAPSFGNGESQNGAAVLGDNGVAVQVEQRPQARRDEQAMLTPGYEEVAGMEEWMEDNEYDFADGQHNGNTDTYDQY
ncbi:hypothetical protein GLOTRDRAFT_134175, partial [Gloeophyllum trabeum ATCC 11539]